MALKPLNSVGGFSVGEVPANIILANGDITASNATFSGNVLISNSTNTWGVLTDNLYYSNGTPWDFQQAAGANGELQFNMGDDFAASPNLTFDNTTQLFTVTGNANITGTLTAGALNVDEIFNGNSNVAIPVANGNVNISVSGNANVLVVTGTGANVAGTFDATGNVEGANLRTNDGYIESTSPSVGLYLIPGSATAGIVGYGKFVPNANVSHDIGSTTNYWANLYANNATIAANLQSGNANLGNAAVANYANINFDLGVTQTVFAANLVANVSANVSNIQVANFVVSNLTPSTDDQYSLGTTLKRWKDINISGNANIATLNVSGNGSFLNLNFGNLLTGNYANFSNDVVVQGNIANANNISVTNALNANTGNFSGNISALNANLGNLATANYINVAQNVDINGSLDATNANFVGNIAISNSNPAFGILTDNLYYANGQPWDLQEAAGNTGEVQFNNGDDFAASANFTFDAANSVLTVTGNANVTNTLLTPNVNSGTGNLTLTANGYSSVYENNGNVTFPGNVMAGTFYGNVNANITVTAANTSVLYSDNGLISGATGFTFDKNSNLFSTPGNLDVAGFLNVTNNANINGMIISQTTLLGDGNGIQLKDDTNGAQLNYNNVNYIYVDSTGASLESNAFIATLDTNGNFALPNNLSVVGNISNANNISVTNALDANTGNFSGNITTLNANLGNLAQANFVNVASNLHTANANVTNLLEVANVNVSSNLTVSNLTVNLELAGNTANFSSNVQVHNLDVNLELSGNTANFTGATIAQNVTANSTVFAANANVSGTTITNELTVNNAITGNTANFSSNVVVNNLTTNLELAGNTANFIGNVTLSGPNVVINNHLSGNTASFNGNISALNANLGNLVDANFIRTDELFNGNSNVRIAPNGNVTVSVTGLSNVHTFSNTGINVVGYVEANGNGTFGALYSNTLTAQGGNLTIYAATGDNYVELRPSGNGQVDVGNFRIQSLANPVNAQDAATKFYVDTVAEGLHIHASCGAATPNTLAVLSGGTVTYNNGTAGVGATLVTTGTYTLIDGVNVASSGFRILVKNEANAAHNGIYTYTNSTTLTRATDFDTAAEIAGGDFTFVTAGTLYNSTGWVQIDEVLVVGTDPIVWDQFSGAGEYTAGAGLTLTGTVFSVNVDNLTTEIAGGNVVVKANAQLTTPNIGAATGTSIDLTGNVLANNVNSNNLITTTDLQASGNILSNNISANANLVVNNATVNLELSGNTANFSGNVVVPNLTVNTTLSGNVANFSGNLTSLNANLGNLATANYINVANTLTTVDANVTGTLTVANANIGGNITVNNLTVNLELTGNTANFSGNVVLPNLTVNTTLSGNVANFSGNVTVPNLTVNLELSGNTANFSGNIVAGNISTSGSGGNITGANVVSANTFVGNLDATTADISANLVTSNLTVNLETSGNTANFSGNVILANLVANGVANVGNLYVVSNVTSDLLPNANLTLDLGSSSQRWDNVYAGNINASGNLTIGGDLSANNFSANTLTANTSVDVGNTAIYWGEVTTTSTAANQTISTVSVTGVTGVEWLVKGVDSSGAKYSMAMVTAVTDGTGADYSTFGTVNLGSTTGTLAVNIVGSNVELQVTPSSSNSTVWVTQYRTI
jgi:hypothetical protein